ncbi:serine protease 1-like [Drosophila tropicalis]|uniref:serine protease 1-like n=1 Tax=Drosophila tropicalis TaxID=46794 RepID=UPI0035ABDDD2
MKGFTLILIAAIACTAAAFEKPVVVKDMPVGNNIQGRITNGYPAYEGKVPYIVGLGFQSSSGGWWCGGSIIGNTWVLTAAHCTNGAESVTIYYGATWRLQPQYTHWVSSNDIVQHHEYNTDTLHNDISLIRTPHVDFWSLVNKVELPSYDDRYNNYYGWWALLSGWGKTSNDGGVTDYLNCVDIQIADNSICEAHFGTTFITPNHVCIATPDNKGSCSGDSGGPLVLHDGNRQVAIVSFGSSLGCEANAPKGMTRVTSYLDWIRDNTGISY